MTNSWLLSTAEAELLAARMRGDTPRPKRRAPRLPQRKRQRVFARDGWACVSCGAAENLTIDHIVARVNGGGSRNENLQTLCQPCNLAKGDS